MHLNCHFFCFIDVKCVHYNQIVANFFPLAHKMWNIGVNSTIKVNESNKNCLKWNGFCRISLQWLLKGQMIIKVSKINAIRDLWSDSTKWMTPYLHSAKYFINSGIHMEKKTWRKKKIQCWEYIFDVVKETKFILSSYFTVTGCHAIL